MGAVMSEPGRWRDALAMGDLPPVVRDRVGGWLTDDPPLGRAAVRSLAVAGLARAHAVGVLGESALELRDEIGFPFVLVPIAFSTPEHEGGEPRDVSRLLRALEGALGRWRFMLHLRRPLPPGFDPASVAQAVHLWRLAMDRGEWRGRHAVYEDETVAIDLAVTSRSSDEEGGGALGMVPPIPAPERVAEVYQRVVGSLHDIEEAAGHRAVVFGLVAEPSWRLPRGYVSDLLYGLADRVTTESGAGPSRYEAVHRATGVHLFSDPTCRNVAAVWWLEPSRDLGTRGCAYENPWCQSEAALVFPGARYAIVERGLVKGRAERRPAVLAWHGERTTDWSDTP
jgi:hypothetical protein